MQGGFKHRDGSKKPAEATIVERDQVSLQQHISEKHPGVKVPGGLTGAALEVVHATFHAEGEQV